MTERKAGRPKGKRYEVEITLNLEEEMHKQLKDLAISLDSNVNALIRQAIKQYLGD